MISVKRNHKCKICLIGDSQVGKTGLCIRLKDDTFSENFSPTIGVDFLSFSLFVNTNYNLSFIFRQHLRLKTMEKEIACNF
ncbi:unnamed protein product [Rotaria socialis]